MRLVPIQRFGLILALSCAILTPANAADLALDIAGEFGRNTEKALSHQPSAFSRYQRRAESQERRARRRK